MTVQVTMNDRGSRRLSKTLTVALCAHALLLFLSSRFSPFASTDDAARSTRRFLDVEFRSLGHDVASKRAADAPPAKPVARAPRPKPVRRPVIHAAPPPAASDSAVAAASATPVPVVAAPRLTPKQLGLEFDRDAFQRYAAEHPDGSDTAFGVGAGDGDGDGGAGSLGLVGSVCFIPSGTTHLRDLGDCQEMARLRAYALNVPPRRWTVGFPGVVRRVEWFSIDYWGAFRVSRNGNYRFRLLSDDGSLLWIDGKLVIDNDGEHEPVSVSGTAHLTASDHGIRVRYYQGPRDRIALQLFVTPPGERERLWTTEL